MTIPSMFPVLGGRFSMMNWKIGVKITSVPVMKADLDGVVSFKPTVWKTNPKKRSSPKKHGHA